MRWSPLIVCALVSWIVFVEMYKSFLVVCVSMKNNSTTTWFFQRSNAELGRGRTRDSQKTCVRLRIASGRYVNSCHGGVVRRANRHAQSRQPAWTSLGCTLFAGSDTLGTRVRRLTGKTKKRPCVWR
jgi:hypothetical protein